MSANAEMREGGLGASVGLTGAAFVLIVAAVACSDSTGPLGANVVAVEVTSPIDTIMAEGRSAQLGAVARDKRGALVPAVALTWSSSDAGVASVSNKGVVDAFAPGSTVITAAAGRATGSLNMRVVAVDLDAIVALLADPYATALIDRLGEAPRDHVQAAIAACHGAKEAGHVIAMGECLESVTAEAAAVTDGTRRVLAAMLGIFAQRGWLLLDL